MLDVQQENAKDECERRMQKKLTIYNLKAQFKKKQQQESECSYSQSGLGQGRVLFSEAPPPPCPSFPPTERRICIRYTLQTRSTGRHRASRLP